MHLPPIPPQTSLPTDDCSNTTILIIEDSSFHIEVIDSLLDTPSMKKTFAKSLASGMKKLDQSTYDVLILDLSVGDSDGLDTLIAVRNLSKTIPIVVLTSNEDESLGIQALRHGAQEYLQKNDLSRRDLQRTIRYARERMLIQKVDAERMRLYEQREDIIAALTHDLKNPLIGSKRILELMIQGRMGAISEEQLETLACLKDSNKTLLELIDCILEIHRYEQNTQTLYLEAINLKELIAKQMRAIHPLIEDRGITMQTDLSSATEPILADKSSMLRVIDNLIANAMKFVPDGGSISVRLWQENRKRVLFQISDTGPGIPEADRDQLFRRFFQGEKSKTLGHGTGLGLYLCRQIVQAHNGHIWCDSVEGEGSTFTVSLPLAG